MIALTYFLINLIIMNARDITVIETEFRVENDFLGSKQVDKNAYYGIQTLRAVENFPITGYRVHKELIKAMGIVKKPLRLQIWKLVVSIEGLEKL